MANSQFSLLWNSHKKNLSTGLSTLQQNGEFVDMTLAADGHMVKVHQVIVALASPYVKELISTAQCPHPVIFLNKISYTTLCAILEYVYTGEVLVSVENLNEFLEAGKELHIKGLEDMKIHDSYNVNQSLSQNDTEMDMETLNDEVCYFEISDGKSVEDVKYNVTNREEEQDTVIMTNDDSMYTDPNVENAIITEIKPKSVPDRMDSSNSDKGLTVMQYTVSNQGSLQMILNRYVYYLKHTNKDNTRQWRCVDYLNNVKCPAHVITRDDVVIQRIHAHIHPFHDKRILKKVRDGAVFTAIKEAEQEGKNKRNEMKNE